MMVRSDQRSLERERATRRGRWAAFRSQASALDEPSAYGTWRIDRPPIELEPLPWRTGSMWVFSSGWIDEVKFADDLAEALAWCDLV
ncbi:hypothetical protein GCM10010094_48640 [Streptomyces flaveus]|uniref:Uncharacterized protein n=1 Tax=Streptomyces flaveus TaxID=66370 RepID=A0A917VIC1_9ACTN|nr:hypothetical protein GCM10010094_48640 [Streptomyces flaveus]